MYFSKTLTKSQNPSLGKKGGCDMERGEKVQAGTLKVSESVIATIARLATIEVAGVESLTNANSTFKNVFLKQSENDAIKVRLAGDVVEISISILVKFGHKVVVISEQIQNNVKASVQSMTGVAVARVNVSIAGVVFDDVSSDNN